MPRIMYDSVNPFAIPEHAQMVLVYVDGIYKWSQAGRDRFRHAQQVTCSAVGAVVAQVGDVEPGCIWPVANAVPYVRRQRAAGLVGCIYINEVNDWGPCREAFRRAGEPEPLWLVANYNGRREIPPGAIGRQYAHPSEPLGNPNNVPWHTAGHWDESWVADHWPGVDERGPGGGRTDMKKEFDMRVVQAPSGIYVLGSTGKLHLTSDAQVELYMKVCEQKDAVLVPQDQIDAAPESESAGTLALTPEDREAIAGKVRLGLLEDLEPLFALARKLVS